MKRVLLLSCVFYYGMFNVYSQPIPPAAEQQLENLSNTDQAETEDDSYLQQLEQFRRHPIRLNTADASELKELRIISDLQIESLLRYRGLLGNLVSIYELQAVPLWDIATIRRLLPFITVGPSISLKENIRQRISEGEHSFLLRMSQILERSEGFDRSSSGTKYRGSPQKIFFRYRYTYKNLLQFGMTGDKDAGEQFFRGAQNTGFDFYSFHLFARKIGSIQALAIGDFTVNMGQGLIQWQSLSFKKSADAMSIKRQSPVIRPYNSAAEFNFFRGAAITIKKKDFEFSFFGSVRKLSANIATNGLSSQQYITSLLVSGYHRTASEIADRNRVKQFVSGGNLQYKKDNLHAGVNTIFTRFSLPIEKKDEPYNLFALRGDSWFNLSMDYSYTYKNMHLFGEFAVDKQLDKAFISGMLISADPAIDISLLFRDIKKEYRAVSANAFTESSAPSNENGLYAGMAIRPSPAWRIEAYADLYRSPWLKFQVDAPNHGRDMLVQLSYAPDKRLEISTRYRNERKQGNDPAIQMPTNRIISFFRQNWRIHADYKVNSSFTMRNRIELVWTRSKYMNSEKGFLMFCDLIYKPLSKNYSGSTRFQFFETGGYDSRLYAFESDVLFSHSIPAFFDKGFRYYFNFNYDFLKRVSLWFRWSQTLYHNKNSYGSGLDEVYDTKRSEIRIQLLYMFN